MTSRTDTGIAIIGAGAWGTALAQTAAKAGRDVTLWSFEQDVTDAVNAKHENTIYLPDVKLSEAVVAAIEKEFHRIRK